MNQNSKPKRCVLFARCNRDGNNSVQQQVKMMHAYSRQQRLHVVDEIQIKNQSAHGPEAAEALGQLCQRKTKHDDFDVLLTTDLSRLCRGPICRWIHLQKQLADAGVELVTLDHGHIDLRISITFHGGVPKKKKEWKLHNAKKTKAPRAAQSSGNDGRREQGIPVHRADAGDGTCRKRTTTED